MFFPFQEVQLDLLEFRPNISKMMDIYTKKQLGNYRIKDWRRINYVDSKIKHKGKLLDIGVGCGEFINIQSTNNSFSEVRGVDIKKHTKFYRHNNNYKIDYISATELSYPQKSFNTVVCMEILEHLYLNEFTIALKNIRDICLERLLITVPFEEPEPIYHGHHLRFTKENIFQYFPDAEFFLLKKTQKDLSPWILIIENYC